MGILVKFTDRSKGGPVGWDWDFGDGSEHSFEQNPTHEYDQGGTYYVTLVASLSSLVKDSATERLYLGTPVPVASFTWSLDI